MGRKRERNVVVVEAVSDDARELRRYLDILRRRWLVVATVFLVTVVATLYFVLPQPTMYESKGTFVVVPRAANVEESLQAFDTLIRGAAINSTYATIAASNLVRNRARARLGSSVDASDATVTADVHTGTNILSITVTSRDPESAEKLAFAVGQESISYVAALNEAYRLQPLDLPERPEAPVGPKKGLTIGTGMFLGLFVGIALAVAIDFVLSQFSRTTREPGQPVDYESDGTDDDDGAEVTVLQAAGVHVEDVPFRHFPPRSQHPARRPPPPPPAKGSRAFPVALERSVWCP